MSDKALAYLSVITACLFWGISYMSSKIALSVFTPLTLAFSRFFIASIVLFIILKIKEGTVRIQKEDLIRFVLSGVVGVALYFTFENNGIRLTSASLASMIIASVPVFGLLGDCIINKSKMTLKKVFSVILSLVGVYFIVTGNNAEIEFSGHFLGYIFMFGAAIIWVTTNFIIRPLYEKYSGLAISFYQILFGTLALAPFAVINYPKADVFQTTIIVNVLFLALCCSAAGYFLYIFALHRLGVTVTTLFVNFVPVITVISSFLILHEQVTWVQLMGGLIVILSVSVISVNKREQNTELYQE